MKKRKNKTVKSYDKHKGFYMLQNIRDEGLHKILILFFSNKSFNIYCFKVKKLINK